MSGPRPCLPEKKKWPRKAFSRCVCVILAARFSESSFTSLDVNQKQTEGADTEAQQTPGLVPLHHAALLPLRTKALTKECHCSIKRHALQVTRGYLTEEKGKWQGASGSRPVQMQIKHFYPNLASLSHHNPTPSKCSIHLFLAFLTSHTDSHGELIFI